jgi:predicted DNA-binding transcriptional regulator YafY
MARGDQLGRQWKILQMLIDFSAQTAGLHDLRIWVLSWGSKARVLAPENLKKMIKLEIEVLNQLYE